MAVVIDDGAARAFLVRALGADPASIEPVRPGEWSRVYGVRRGGEHLVVRFNRYREDFEKDRLVALWSSADLPVPPVLEIGDALGVAYAVSPRVGGVFLESLDEARTRAVLPRLFAALDAAREIDLSSTTGFGGWTAAGGGIHRSWREAVLAVGESNPPGRHAGWRERLEASPTGAGPFDDAYAALRELVAFCPEERHLIHDDLLNRNVLVDGDRITAVLDWGSSIYGDFLHDVALLVYGKDWFPGARGIDLLGEARRHYAAIGLDVAHLEERVRCYAVRTGLGGMSYNAWKGAERGTTSRGTRGGRSSSSDDAAHTPSAVARVFLPDVGFRDRGMRLVAPITSEAAGRTLTLRDLIATADGTELTYDLSYEDNDDEVRARESILIRHRGRDHELGSGTVAVWSKEGVWRRSLRSKRAFAASPGRVEVEVAISGLGEWHVIGEIAAFGEDIGSLEPDSSDTRDGITVRLHAVSMAKTVTAVELSASSNTDGVCVEGIGAYLDARLGPNALTLRDQALRAYPEVVHDPRLSDAMPQGRDLALFEGVAEDARELALEVPYVVVEDRYDQATFDVPVTTPVAIAFGRHRAQVLRTYVTDGTAALARPYRGPGLGVDIDLGGWQEGRRILLPRRVLVDDVSRGFRYTNRFDARSPEPVQQFEIPTDRAREAGRVTLIGALVQVHGPWVLRFTR